MDKIGQNLGKHNEDHNSTLEITANTKRVLHSKVSSSTLFDEVVQDEDEAKYSTHSTRIEESLHAVNHSPDVLEVHEIFDISYPHISETEE